ncbi:MAG: translation initiation factor IF-3 [Chlamydiia bacterium]
MGIGLRVNFEIRVPRVRLIGPDGEQVGVVAIDAAMRMAEEAGLDLVEMSAAADPPVCKVMDVGKYRYDQTKRERESRKVQHQVKIKEVKVKPNIDDHDFMTKVRHAREFISKGCKVRVSCMFRGREMLHQDIGHKVVERFTKELEDVATLESPAKMLGRTLSLVLNPGAKKRPQAS